MNGWLLYVRFGPVVVPVEIFATREEADRRAASFGPERPTPASVAEARGLGAATFGVPTDGPLGGAVIVEIKGGQFVLPGRLAWSNQFTAAVSPTS